MKPTLEDMISDLKAYKDFFIEQTGGSYPLCFDYAIKAIEKQIADEKKGE